MRAELPWNVAGIPPEAREAARAAARREGLSVGEWLTRRILRSFSALEEDASTAAAVPLDSWGLPVSAASRRDSEEMLARVGRSETESTEAWRRIEDQLKGLSRRIDSSERNHGENNRVLSRTNQEMSLAAREQAQVFDQLGHDIMGLNQRLERLEHSTANENIREAIKALHLGLSRLADQISATANNSTGQLAQVTTNLEKLATQLNQVWEDAESADQLLDRRIDVTELELGQRIDNAQKVWEARLSAAEKTTQFNTNALDHALEKIEEATAQRDHDLAEAQGRAAQQEERATRQQESVQALQQSLQGLEARLPQAGLEHRLDDLEHAVHGLADEFGQHDIQDKVDVSLQALSLRLEKLEQDHTALIADVHAKLSELNTTPAPKPVEPPAFEVPPFTEPPQQAQEDAHWPPPEHAAAPHPDHHEPINAFTPPAHDLAFESTEPQEPHADPNLDKLVSDLSDAFEDDVFEDSGHDNFLAQARRSAHAASEQVEGENRERLSNFRWNPENVENEEKARPRFLIPLIVALLVVLAAAAALILSQRAKAPTQVSTAQQGPTFSVPTPPKANDTQLAVAPEQNPANNDDQTNDPFNSLPTSPEVELNNQASINDQANNQANNQAGQQAATELSSGARDFTSQRSEPAAADVAHPAPQREAPKTPVRPVSQPAAAKISTPIKTNPPAKTNTPVSADRVNQLANAGNATALAILGLKALEGGNSSAISAVDAVKYLTQAAEKGQAVAQYRLGTLYERGQGVTPDPVKAMHWYELSANQGNRKAMHNLAVAYASGPAGKRNMTEAARWFVKAAALGLSDSQFNLAVLYERGDGVPQSLVDAYKWYSIAAVTGDAESKARMGVLQTQLSEADKAAANRSAASFHAAPLNRAANVPPEPVDLGN